MAFVYLPPVTVDDLSRTASDHRPRPLPPPPRPPLDLTPPPCLAAPPGHPFNPGRPPDRAPVALGRTRP